MNAIVKPKPAFEGGAKRCASAAKGSPRPSHRGIQPVYRRPGGTVPKASVDDVRPAFEYAAAYRAKLTRYERAQILERAAALLRERTEESSDLIIAGIRFVETGFAVRDWPCRRRAASSAPIEALNDDGQSFSCDLTPHGKPRRVFRSASR